MIATREITYDVDGLTMIAHLRSRKVPDLGRRC